MRKRRPSKPSQGVAEGTRTDSPSLWAMVGAVVISLAVIILLMTA